tara:strand:+ start:266 stop:874 length:609 start_codon:yes stop_codon:yes gene_type:complete
MGEFMRNLLIGAVALFMTSTIFAQSKYFLSYELSDNEWDTGVAVVSGAVLDEDDNGYAILGGIHLNDNLDIELGYKDFGEASLAGASGNRFTYEGTTYQFNATATITMEGDAYLIGVKPKYKLSESLSLYGRLGVSMWDVTLGVATGTSSANVDDDGNDIYYGLGIQGKFGGLDFSLAHSKYEFDSDEVDSNALSVSYMLNF